MVQPVWTSIKAAGDTTLLIVGIVKFPAYIDDHDTTTRQQFLALLQNWNQSPLLERHLLTKKRAGLRQITVLLCPMVVMQSQSTQSFEDKAAVHFLNDAETQDDKIIETF